MPVYTFVCRKCGKSVELVRQMKEADNPVICSCDPYGQMERDYQADLPNVSGGDYHRPIVSDSLAVSPEQIAEHKQLFPDIQVTPEGQPVFDNFKQHDDYLKATGFRKKRQKLKSKGVKIGGKSDRQRKVGRDKTISK